jgi:hypothetical protein
VKIEKWRSIFLKLVGLSVLFQIYVCGENSFSARKEIVLNVYLYSYLDRPIFDIYLNGVDLGVANKFGGTGTVSGVAIPFGAQTLTWRLGGPRGMARNGEAVNVKNTLIIMPKNIPGNTRYLGIHIYPNNSAEFSLSQHIPDRTPQGRDILEKVKNNKM